MRRGTTILVSVLLVLPAVSVATPTAADTGWETGRNDYRIEMRDGTVIDATMVVPEGTQAGDELPAVIVIHGYGGDKDVGQARVAAEHGYVGFAYSTRGFGESTGEMDIAGPASIEDLKELIAWLKEEGPVHPDEVGVTGASYGGGHSVQIATEPDAGIATAVPIVPWTDLERALAPNDVFKYSYTTGFYATGNGLAQSGDEPVEAELLGEDLGRRCLCDTYEEAVHRWYLEFWTGLGTADAEAGMAQRSAIHEAHQVEVPIFIIQGLNDDLFPGDQGIDMFEEIPHDEKKLYLGYVGHPRANPDTDAPEARYLFDQVYEWFDHYLKGEGERPFDPDKPIEVGHRPWTGETFNVTEWTHGEEGKLWSLDPDGELVPPGGPVDEGVATVSNTYVAGLPDDPVIPWAIDDRWQDLPRGTPVDTATFTTDPLSEDTTLLGTPRAELRLTSTGAEHQVSVKIFDKAPDGTRELVTRGIYGARNNLPGATYTLSFDLQPYHHTFPTDHAIEVQVAASDFPAYWPYTNPFTTVFELGPDAGTGIRLPTT